MKRVLIITYYWPPSAGSGVQRWLKFSKYLPENGWQPVVYTPSNPDFETKDTTLLNDVSEHAELLQTKIWEPYGFYKKFSSDSNKKNINNGLLETNTSQSSVKKGAAQIAKWIRGNVFIPDPKVFWVKKSVRYLVSYLRENPVDAIVTTGPPHSMHLIGKGIKQHIDIPWIADFRDPWSKLDLLDDYNISKSSRKKYESLERGVLEASDICLTVSNNWAQMFKKLGAKNVEVITNGFDESDVSNSINEKSDRFIISHFGLLNHLRNPKSFWIALEQVCEEHADIREALEIHIGGTVDGSVLEELNGFNIVSEKIIRHGYIAHTEVLKWYQKSSLLLLLTFNSEIGKGNIPGKLFEYIAMSKPIIAFGHPEGDVANILNEANAGNCFPYVNLSVEHIKKSIIAAFEAKDSNDKNHSVERYNRENLTKSLVILLDKLSK